MTLMKTLVLKSLIGIRKKCSIHSSLIQSWLIRLQINLNMVKKMLLL